MNCTVAVANCYRQKKNEVLSFAKLTPNSILFFHKDSPLKKTPQIFTWQTADKSRSIYSTCG